MRPGSLPSTGPGLSTRRTPGAGWLIVAEQPPVWDGSGVDPWLPARLDAALEAAVWERQVRDAVWSRLSGWIVAARRAVLDAPRPDASAIWALVPQWEEAVREVVAGPLTDATGAAYEKLFGPGVSFESRPAVVEHLSTVTNRMSWMPDDVHNLVVSQVAQGAEAGESIPTITRRIQGVLDEAGTPRWANQAVTIARTETVSALNAGRSDAFAMVSEELDQPMETRWLATADRRTRPSHARADGQRIPVGGVFVVGGALLRYPGDPGGPARETVLCRCTTLLLEPGEDVDLSNRQFQKPTK